MEYMVDTWISLPVGERRRWLKDISDISADTRIECYELASTHGSFDGEWSYALFVLDPAHPELLTAYFPTVYLETLEGGFNPLNHSAGLSLTQEEGRGLITLLEAQMDKLAEKQVKAGSAFQLLKEEEYAEFHLFPPISKHTAGYFYRQVQPHGGEDGDDISTILLFGKELPPYQEEGPYADVMLALAEATHLYEGVYFQTMQFPNHKLQNPDFRPRDYALPRIYLDKADIGSLIALFQRFLA